MLQLEWRRPDFQKALEYHEKSLQIKIKSLGPHHVEVASTYNNIGNVEIKLGKNSWLHSTSMKRHVTCFVEKAGFEPRTLGTDSEAERYDHCATRSV